MNKKKLFVMVLGIIAVLASPMQAMAANADNGALSTEEKAELLHSINGGSYETSDEPMSMAELNDLLINAYGLAEAYVKAEGTIDTNTPDDAFFDFGGGGDEDMSFMRGNLAYVVTKLYNLSEIQIDIVDAWQHMGQSGYSDVDDPPIGYPGNKEAVYLCRQLGITIPQISDTELGFGEPITKADFTNACYDAYLIQLSKEDTPDENEEAVSPEAEQAEPSPVTEEQAVPEEPAETADVETAEVINCHSLNVRKGPAMQYQVVQWLQKGDMVQVLEEKNHWIYIESEKGTGWVFETYLTK